MPKDEGVDPTDEDVNDFTQLSQKKEEKNPNPSQGAQRHQLPNSVLRWVGNMPSANDWVTHLQNGEKPAYNNNNNNNNVSSSAPVAQAAPAKTAAAQNFELFMGNNYNNSLFGNTSL